MENLLDQLEEMKALFVYGRSNSYEYRYQQLITLKEALYAHECEIYDALYLDLKKNREECWITELGFIINEINYALKNLHRWIRPRKAKTNLLNFPSKSYIIHEPLGVVLIIGPWNYPLQLLLTPLVGAIAAGNSAVLKPSEFAPATAAVLKEIIGKAFDKSYVQVIEGDGSSIIPFMMDKFRFDHVFYTGSTVVGQLVYELAAKKLVPVTLELGGKSPCIVEKDANIKVTARRIALTKFTNAGQMCVAPDYVLIHESIRTEFINELKKATENFYTADKVKNYHYGKIINQKHFRRLVAYLQNSTIVFGGNYNEESLFIHPTLVENVSPRDVIMNEEIFGPILPIIGWETDEEVYGIINKNHNPLALYVFTSSRQNELKWTSTIPFGGGCINNAGFHVSNHHLPFGGRGNSGLGNYHGEFSFYTFSHKKAIMKTPVWFDPSIKYPPFKGKLKWLKKLFK